MSCYDVVIYLKGYQGTFDGHQLRVPIGNLEDAQYVASELAPVIEAAYGCCEHAHHKPGRWQRILARLWPAPATPDPARKTTTRDAP